MRNFKKWLIEDFKKDIKKIKANPELFIASLFFVGVGAGLTFLGWNWMNLPAPPIGHYYITDYHLQGSIFLVVGLSFLGLGLLLAGLMNMRASK